MVPDAATLMSSQIIYVELTSGPDRGSSSLVRSPDMDMKFILSICHGALQKLDSKAQKSLFPLAVFASLARKCIRSEDTLVDDTGTSLDRLWHEICLPIKHRRVSQSLWEEKIPNECLNQAQKWIFKAAREHVEAILQNEPSTSQSEDKDNNGDNHLQSSRILAASIVAWLQFSASKLEATILAVWNREWDHTWHETWKRKWEAATWEGKSAYSRIALIQLGKIVSFSDLTGSDFADTIRASGTLSGRTAGAASMELLSVSKTLEPLGKQHLEHGEGVLNNNQRDKSTAELVNNCSSTCLRCWRTLRYSASEQTWVPVWESATNVAWALAWEEAVSMGLDLAQSQTLETKRPEEAHTTAQITTSPGASKADLGTTPICAPLESHEHPNKELKDPKQTQTSTSHSKRPTRFVKMKLAKIVETVMTRTNAQHRYPSALEERIKRESASKLYSLIEKLHTEDLINTAWNQARTHAGSPESTLDVRAEQAFELAKESNKGINWTNLVSAQEEWQTAFTDTWEDTWKACWKASWNKVVFYTATIVWEKGVLEGTSIAENEQDLIPDSYHGVKEALSGINTVSQCYWPIRSMFKALDVLHRALAHAIPTCYQKTMGISIVEPSDKATHTLYQCHQLSSKPNSARDGEDESQLRKLTHAELQKEIKAIIRRKSREDEDYEKRLNLMDEIWRVGIRTYTSPVFAAGFDPEPSTVVNVPGHPSERRPGEGGRTAKEGGTSRPQRVQSDEQTTRVMVPESPRIKELFRDRFDNIKGVRRVGSVVRFSREG